ncbi:MAG: flagellar basal body-associated protein FliL [Nitrosomonas sp.]|nr:flagellar basal body-associated protein FliL [Nitrosomonas sp.]
MSEAEVTETEKTKPNKKGKLLIILIVILALGGGIGGTWYYMQGQIEEYEGDEPRIPKKKPTTFVALDIFTVNLLPEESNSYLQVGLTIKAHETEVIDAIAGQMPEIRNRILLLLSSKQAAEISTIIGKQQLSTDITNEIKQVFDSEEMQNDIVGVLFTSFVIQ